MKNANQLDRRNIRNSAARTTVSHETHIANKQRVLRSIAAKCLWIDGKRGVQLRQYRDALRLNIKQHQIALTK